MANEQTFRTLFENDYTDYKAILENLIKPVFGEKVKMRNQDLSVDTQDKAIISGIKIFADIGGAFPINFVDVTIKSKVKIRYNKVTVQRCVRKITDNLQSALIFFHYEDVANRNWRITFVNKGESANDSTNPKRYTYLCGKNVSCKTCSDRFSVLKTEISNGNKILDELMKNAFSVETVSNEFFAEYKVFYEDFVQFITGNRYIKKSGGYEKEKIHDANKTIFQKFLKLANGVETDAQKLVRDYIKKMMGRLVFLQFLQKKHWLGVEQNDENWISGDLNFIYNLFKVSSIKEQEDFLESVLEPLFFGMLNTSPAEREKRFSTEGWNEKLLTRFKKIPYLNGGLFAKDELDEIKIKFPKELFCNPQKAEVERVFSGKNNDYDYKAYCGLLDFFNRYNFTIDESDPSDVEVGVDPEMLGKIFENLLEDNKDKGAFYTPKEIVNYMCRESLTAFLVNSEELIVNSGEEKIRAFVNNPCMETIAAFTLEQLSTLNYKLSTVKVCDPAVGSGAFPMGLLNLLFACRHALEIENGKLRIGNSENSELSTGNSQSSINISRAEIKKEIVKNNIYGVDIEKGAVDIARLRFWLSIVVDADKPEPLPNLDYKIMQGNSLIESYRGTDLSNLLSVESNWMFDADTEQLQSLQNAINGYYEPNDSEAKEKIQAIIKEKVIDILQARLSNPDVISDLKKINLSSTSEFFLWHTWFSDVFSRPTKQIDNGELKVDNLDATRLLSSNEKEMPRGLDFANAKSGFDIVIGNPPYISAPTQIANEQLAHQRELLAKSNNYKTLYQKWDLYIPFMEKGLRLLAKGGSFAMIVPYPLSNQLYGKIFREWVLKNYDVSEITDLNGTKVFENATVSNLILFATATEPKGKTKISHINEKKEIKVDFVQNEGDLVQDEKTKVWNLTQEKRETNRHADMHVLGDYCYISKGMVLNSDEKIAKGEFKKDDLISETKDEIHCREYIEAKDIERYFIKRIRYLEYDTERIPEKLSRPTFKELYENPKILTSKIGKLFATVDENNLLCDQTNRILILWYDLHNVENNSISNSIKKFSKMSRQEMEELSKTVSLKYLLGIMNSKYTSVLFDNIRGVGNIDVNPEYIRNIPIPQATKEQQQEIISLVDEILVAKKSNPNANTLELEHKIDEIVYGLYGLSKSEIDIVEGK